MDVYVFGYNSYLWKFLVSMVDFFFSQLLGVEILSFLLSFIDPFIFARQTWYWQTLRSIDQEQDNRNPRSINEER